MKDLFRMLMLEGEANSRFALLLQSVVVAASILILTLSFVELTAPLMADAYVLMMATLLGGSSLSHVARMFSKKAGKEKKDG